MTAHVHFDIEDMIRRSRAGIESATAQAMATAPDDLSKRFVEIQRRLHLAHVDGHAEMLRLFNEGQPEDQIARSAAIVICAQVTTCGQLFGPGFSSLLAWQMQRILAGDITVSAKVEIPPVEGGRA